MVDKAVLFGINNYKSISGLQGCENDLPDIRSLLIDTYGFKDGNIRIYRNEEVVQKAIEDGFAWLAEETGTSNRLVFHFSGHGSYTTSNSADKDVDELICLYDMDWKDEKSFIRDTDLGELTKKVSSGSKLTVILDSCHSGTGTRAFTSSMRSFAKVTTPRSPLVIVADSARRLAIQQGEPDLEKHVQGLQKARSTTMAQLRAEGTAPVFARFVAPPGSIQNAIQRRANVRVRALGQSIRTVLNHQLLAAASEKQTAADAFIDGQYRGAFSFHLCATARLNTQQSLGEVMRITTQRIKQNGFSQDPQIEGPLSQEVLFGARQRPGEPGVTTQTPSPHRPAASEPLTAIADNFEPEEQLETQSPRDVIEMAPLQTLDHLLRVSEKLIDLASHRYLGVAELPAFVSSRSTSTEVLVYVHGISEHLPGYSKLWHQALSRHLKRTVRIGEVRWSQLVNDRALTVQATSLTREMEVRSLKAQIDAELERRMDRLESMANQRNVGQSTGSRSVVAIERARSFAVDDFSRYMILEETREAILSEFFKIVTPELEAGNKVHIVSHSWGTVVAYEGLRRLDGHSLPGVTANLFTAGSALSIGAVQSNLFQRLIDGRTPAHVQRIINLDAGGDVVGGAIGDVFSVDREYLGLDPTGCRKIPFTGLAFNPACAHRSYFQPGNLIVNRDIFATYINAS